MLLGRNPKFSRFFTLKASLSQQLEHFGIIDQDVVVVAVDVVVVVVVVVVEVVVVVVVVVIIMHMYKSFI